MSESNSGEKTEQPTPKKLRDAREKGQVAQSKELTTLSGVITVVFVLMFCYGPFFKQIGRTHALMWQKIEKNEFDFHSLIDGLMASLTTVVLIALVPVALAALISGLVNLVQIGGIVISKEAFKIDFNKFNPVNNFKQVFSKKNFIKFFRQFGEVFVMACVAFVIMRKSAKDIMQIYHADLESIIIYISLIISKIFAYLFFIHLTCSILDYILERRNLTKQLMMSLSEIKQEYKNSEGDPEIKGRRRELHRELTEGDGMEEMMGNSTMVLANPTHIAIVIMYSPSRWQLPIVLAKAKGETAQLIFSYAKKLEVPIFRDIWLARQLFSIAELGKYVPSSLLSYVADIIGKNLHLMPRLALEIKQLAEAQTVAAKQPVSNQPKGTISC